MNAVEANLLLTRAGLVDGRRPSEERANVWAEILTDLSYEEGVRALTEFHRTSDDWVQPFHLLRLSRVLRDRDRDEQRRLESRTRQPEPERPPLTPELKVELNRTYRAARAAALGVPLDDLPAGDVMFRDVDDGDDTAVLSEGDFRLPD